MAVSSIDIGFKSLGAYSLPGQIDKSEMIFLYSRSELEGGVLFIEEPDVQIAKI